MVDGAYKPQRFLPYGRQYIDDSDIKAVVESLRGDYLTTGPKVKEFEDCFKQVVNSEHVIATSNGTTALHLACIAAGLEEGDCAIVPTLTFLATANAVRYCGADVVFADVDPATGMLTSETLEAALKKSDNRAKAVLPVHLGGRCVDMSGIQTVAQAHSLTIIADCCHAIGSSHMAGNETVKAGSCAVEDMAAFSFHPVKTIAMGEGGAITTNNPEIAAKLRRLRHHGMSPALEKGLWYYEMPDLGYNYREPDILCSLGISQLNKLDSFLKSRAQTVLAYNKRLALFAPTIRTPEIPSVETGWHLYAIAIDFESLNISRNECMLSLKNAGIGTQVHYIPVHQQPYYTKLYGTQTLSGAQDYYNKTLSLPLFPYMETAEIDYICDTLLSILKLS